VGEKAKGEVIVYNKTLNAKTFPKGTIIQNSGLQFAFENEITVASASETGEGLLFGKESVKVTATTIGPESNLPAGNIFTLKDFPQSFYVAKNQNAFSGGTSRQVPSVSKEDQIKLEEELTAELITKAKQALIKNLHEKEILLNSQLEKVVLAKKFSREVGAEAKELSLNLSLRVNAFSFRRDDLLNLSMKDLNLPPQGFSFNDSQTIIKIDDLKKEKNGDIKAKANITTFLTPQIDTLKEKLKNALIGKTYEQIVSYLKTIENVAGVRVIKEKDLPFLKNKLPINRQNITLDILTY